MEPGAGCKIGFISTLRALQLLTPASSLPLAIDGVCTTASASGTEISIHSDINTMAAATGSTALDYSSIVGLYLIPVAILAPIALGLCVTRIYTRLRRTGKLHIDDWTIIAAEVRLSISLMKNILTDNVGRLYRSPISSSQL